MKTSCFIIVLVLGLNLISCGVHKYGKLGYVKVETLVTENQNPTNSPLAMDYKSIEKYELVVESVEPEMEDAIHPFASKELNCNYVPFRSINAKNVLGLDDNDKKKQRRRIRDYEDDQNLDNSYARKLVTFSVFSFLPIFGLLFLLLTIYRARKEWARIEYKPKVYSGKRKVLIAKMLAIIAAFVKIATFIVGAVLVVLFVLMA